MSDRRPGSPQLSRREIIQMAGASLGVLAQEELLAGVLHGPEGYSQGESPAGPHAFNVDQSRTAGEICASLFGHNLEHTRRAVWQGLSAQMLANRKFCGASTTDRRATTAEEGFIGLIRTQGQPGLDGVAAHWYGIGNSWTNFYVDDELAYAGRTAQRLDVMTKDRWGGIGQDNLDVLAETRYEIRVVLRTHFDMKARLQVCDSTGRETYFQQEVSWSGNEWHNWIVVWTAPKSDRTAKIEVMFEGPGSAWVGSASLLPEDNFRGLRQDVIALLKEISVPVLRWPGGNFTRNWIWKDDLLPVDRRPPVMSKVHETLPFTDNYDFREIGVDDYMALCESLGAQPSLTLNLVDELQNACDLVEYCNGPANSGWGKVRAERGHPAPYAVKYWSVGNEIFGLWMGPAYLPPEEYAKQYQRFAAALHEIDPSIELIASGNEGYCQKLVSLAGKDMELLSVHDYYETPEVEPVGPTRLVMGRKPTLALRKVLEDIRAEIEKGSAPDTRSLPILLDEWNIWPWWFVRPFEYEWHSGPLEGMYVASALNLFCREGQSLGLHSATFFQPINEGCIAVQPHAAHLTAAGQVFRMFRAHHGNLLIKTPRPETDDDLDLFASLDRKRNRIVVSLLNRNITQGQAARLEVARTVPLAVEAQVLSPTDLRDSNSVFAERKLNVQRSGDALHLILPAYSIARIEITLPIGPTVAR